MIEPENKDKRISWLSIFSSLCCNKRPEGDDVFELADQAYAINDKLHKTYPYNKEERKSPFESGDKVTLKG